jgi:hypothetical protein
MLRIPLDPRATFIGATRAIEEHCKTDEMQLLETVDALLHEFGHDGGRWVERLRRTLEAGHSAWAVAPDLSGLTRRVDPTAEAAVLQALDPAHAASNDLAAAWGSAYGHEPNASDAWDHSIKAVEHILQPVVSPNNPNATLGTIIRELRDGKRNFHFVLPGKDESREVEPLLAMLEMLWPNPDRHGGTKHRVPPLEEAQAVVHLAVTVVQWRRSGALTRR